MSEKKKVTAYADAQYFTAVYRTKVTPMSRKTKTSKWLRTGVPEGWSLATKDVWSFDGGALATLIALPDRKQSELLKSLGSYLDEKGLVLQECVNLPAGVRHAELHALAAIVCLEA